MAKCPDCGRESSDSIYDSVLWIAVQAHVLLRTRGPMSTFRALSDLASQVAPHDGPVVVVSGGPSGWSTWTPGRERS